MRGHVKKKKKSQCLAMPLCICATLRRRETYALFITPKSNYKYYITSRSHNTACTSRWGFIYRRNVRGTQLYRQEGGIKGQGLQHFSTVSKPHLKTKTSIVYPKPDTAFSLSSNAVQKWATDTPSPSPFITILTWSITMLKDMSV